MSDNQDMPAENQDNRPWFGRRWYDSTNDFLTEHAVLGSAVGAAAAPIIIKAGGKAVSVARDLGSNAFGSTAAREAGRAVIQETASETTAGFMRGSRIRTRGLL